MAEYRKTLIEVALPLDAINAASARSAIALNPKKALGQENSELVLNLFRGSVSLDPKRVSQAWKRFGTKSCFS